MIGYVCTFEDRFFMCSFRSAFSGLSIGRHGGLLFLADAAPSPVLRAIARRIRCTLRLRRTFG